MIKQSTGTYVNTHYSEIAAVAPTSVRYTTTGEVEPNMLYTYAERKLTST